MRGYGAVVYIRRAVVYRRDDEVVGLGYVLVGRMLAILDQMNYEMKAYSAGVIFYPYCVLFSVYA